jgi:hypothetical protein
MSFLGKVELKRQLQEMGVKVVGEYVRKSDIEKILAGPVLDLKTGKKLSPSQIDKLKKKKPFGLPKAANPNYLL